MTTIFYWKMSTFCEAARAYRRASVIRDFYIIIILQPYEKVDPRPYMFRIVKRGMFAWYHMSYPITSLFVVGKYADGGILYGQYLE